MSKYGWQWKNLTNYEIDTIRLNIFGDVLRPIAEIGRKAVIEELQKYIKFEKERYNR